MLRRALLIMVALVSISAWTLAADATVVTIEGPDDAALWHVTFHEARPGFEMPHTVQVIEAPELAPLGTELALDFTFDLQSAWASIERPVTVGLPEVNQITLYIWVNDETRIVMMEAYEKSQTRWRAKLRLRGGEWNEVPLSALDFYFLLGAPGRGGPTDLVRLAELERIGFTVDGHEIDVGSKHIRLGPIIFQ